MLGLKRVDFAKNVQVESYKDKYLHGGPRSSLWRSREREDRSHIERKVRSLPRQRKRTSKLL